MRTYVLKRLLLMIPTLLGISLILWILMVSAPGRPGAKAQAFGEVNAASDPSKERAKGESQRIFRRQFALDRPVFWNSWTGLSDDDVRRALADEGSVLGAATEDGSAATTPKRKREARERLEDWGPYAVPPLVRLLGKTTGEEQERVLTWLRQSAVRLPEPQTPGVYDAAIEEANREKLRENALLAKWTWKPGAPPEDRTAVVASWRGWLAERETDRFDWRGWSGWKATLTDTQFFKYWSNVFRLDFGKSHVHKRPVVDLIAERLPVTLTLSILAILIAYAVSIPLGIWSAMRPGTVPDQTVSALLFLLYSVPSFFVGSLLLRALTVGDPFRWFPNSGFTSEASARLDTWSYVRDVGWHIVLPLVVMTYASFAQLSRYARSGMLDVVRSDYIRTARAKGLSERTVVYHHAARNGMMPIITLLGSILPSLVGGSIVVEFIFNLRGMGLLILEAISNRDYNVILGESLLVAALTLVGILLSDIAYAVADPRISYE